MSEQPVFVVDEEDTSWVEIHRNEALQRLERMMTEDLVAFEIDATVDETPAGPVATFTWLRVTDDDDQLPVLLAMRAPGKQAEQLSWFIHCDLLED